MKVGDKVCHVDYPHQLGQIVGRYRSFDIGAIIWLVRWNTGQCSRHITAALKETS